MNRFMDDHLDSVWRIYDIAIDRDRPRIVIAFAKILRGITQGGRDHGNWSG